MITPHVNQVSGYMYLKYLGLGFTLVFLVSNLLPTAVHERSHPNYFLSHTISFLISICVVKTIQKDDPKGREVLPCISPTQFLPVYLFESEYKTNKWSL